MSVVLNNFSMYTNKCDQLLKKWKRSTRFTGKCHVATVTYTQLQSRVQSPMT